MRRAVSLLAVLIIVLIASAACATDDGWATAKAERVWVDSDDRTLTIGLHCHPQSRAAVDQHDDGVFIHWELLGDSFGDCLDAEQVVLDAPLAERDVFTWFGRFETADIVEFDPDVAAPGCAPSSGVDVRGPAAPGDCWLRGEWHSLPIDSARVDPDGDLLEVGTHCYEEARVRIVEETAKVVWVALEVSGTFSSDCPEVVSRSDLAPLGERRLADALTDATIAYEPIEVEVD